MNRHLIVFIPLMFVLSTGCSRDKAEISFRVQSNIGSDARQKFQVTVQEDSHTFPQAFQFELDDATRSAGPFRTSVSGTLKITCTMLLDGEKTSTEGVIELPLRADWRWGVDFWISEEDPANTCFGCFGSRAFALDPGLGYGETMKLYIVWGGNSINNPVIY